MIFRARDLVLTISTPENTLSAAIDRFGFGFRSLLVDADQLEGNGAAIVVPDDGSRRTRRVCSAGVAVPETEIKIVNAHTMAVMPDNHVGEIWVQSPCVARGYLHAGEEQTALFSGKLLSAPESSFSYLRTGDKGFLYDGHLFVVGRIKDLLIVNGRNIAPQDIEFFIQEQFLQLRPGCQIAVQVEVSTESRLAEELLLITEVRDQELEALRSNQQKCLDLAKSIRGVVQKQFQVELYAVTLIEPRSIPKTTSGKVRRSDAAALWKSDGLRKIFQATFSTSSQGTQSQGDAALLSPRSRRSSAVPAASPTEETVLGIIRDVFGFSESDFGVTDDILEFGLDSIRLAQLKSRLDAKFSVPAFEELVALESFTARSIAELVKDQGAGGSLRRSSSKHPIALSESDKRGAAGDILSFGQERLLLVHRKLGGSSASYNVPVAVKVTSKSGPLDARFIVECVTKVLGRHSVLSRVYPAGAERGHPVPPSIVIITPSSRDRQDAWREVIDSMNVASRTPFNLQKGPLAKVVVYAVSETEIALFVNIHHIATDGWSMGVLLRDLATALAQEPLKPVSLQFDDYAVFERATLASRDQWAAKLAFWKSEISGLSDALVWLPRKSLGAAERSEAGEFVHFEIGAMLAAQLSALAQSCRTTMYAVCLAAFQVVMYRYSQLDDVFVVSPFANRRYQNVEDMVGYFINTLIVRTNFKDANELSFRQLVGRVKETISRISSYQDFPVELACKPSSELYHPLFRTLFSFRNFPLALEVPGAQVEPLWEVNTAAAMYEFALELQPSPTGTISCVVQYSVDLFTPASIHAWQSHFLTALASVCRNPNTEVSRISMLNEVESFKISSWSTILPEEPELAKVISTLESTNESGVVVPQYHTVHQLISKVATAMPSQIALSHRGRQVTYGDLDALTSLLAAELVGSGFVDPAKNPVVAVVLPRGLTMVETYLALMKAGAAYMPLLITHPDSWVEQLLRESSCLNLVCSGDALHRFKSLAGQIDARIQVVAYESLLANATASRKLPFEPASNPSNLVRYFS